MPKFVIEAREKNGTLKLDCSQPESVFGIAAIRGIGLNLMARTIQRTNPKAVLDGRHVATWPTFINPNWVARSKTW